jgi:signal transduction histidine kinase
MKRAVLHPRGVRDPLAAVEQAAVAEEILSTIRHDLRNKLATVRNTVYYIQRRLKGSDVCEKDPRVELFLGTMDQEMVAADETLSEGRAAAHLAATQPKRASAPECVERAASLSRIDGDHIRIEATMEAGDIALSPDELAVAMRCLIENAAEAMPGGGLVTIRAAADGQRFRIEVADEGRGLPEGANDSVIQAFFTTKPGHLGLGLAIANRVARRGGGQLILGREPSAGVLATLSFPMATREDPGAGP